MQFFLSSINKLPELTGVYLFKNVKNEILYIGKAINIKKRVTSYFQNTTSYDTKRAKLVKQITKVEVIPVQSEFEALLFEARLIKFYQPKYNVSWKDDKHYIYIKITPERFPRVLLCRKEDEKKAAYFGPFPSTKTVRNILSYIRTIFPYCTQKPLTKKSCFYTHIGLCHPCPGEIRKKDGEEYLLLTKKYRKNIREIKALLEGKLVKVKKRLEKEMSEYCQKLMFEEAAKARDRLHSFNYLTTYYQSVDQYLENREPAKVKWQEEQRELQKILSEFYPQIRKAERIECFDVSNLSGTNASGSMVTFIDGQPAKNYYRRFRIKTKNTPDDFTMLSEVMERRLKHKEWTLPDLMIIDGGKPQLLALQKVFKKMKLKPPFIGLAKKEEELVIPKNSHFVRINLPQNSNALNLIKRLRDEAHRFAHKYHQLLRLKYLLCYDNLNKR